MRSWKEPFEYEPGRDVTVAGRAERLLSIPVPSDNPLLQDPALVSPVIPESSFIADDRDAIDESDKSVLIIEDDARFATVVRNLARKKGYKCVVASNGRSGLQLAHDYTPDAIILDLRLPDIDGIDVLGNLKDDLATRHVPVHVISGREDSAVSLQKGAAGYLRKPVSAQEIDDVFSTFEKILASDIRELLLVEDDETARMAISTLLETKDLIIGGGSWCHSTRGTAHVQAWAKLRSIARAPYRQLEKQDGEEDLQECR